MGNAKAPLFDDERPESPRAPRASAAAPPQSRAASAPEHQASPLQTQLVFRLDPKTGQPVEGQLQWGLIPHFEKSWPAVLPINARAETLTEKAMFADAYRKRRCVVPMNKFFLKDKFGKRRSIERRDGQVFGVAGIWENWRSPASGEWIRTFATITVEANDLIAPIHDRMPAILEKDEFERWLGPEEDPRDLLRPYCSELLKVSGTRNR